MELAPIILFVYNRPWHTEQTLEALMANELANESILYVYADGPRRYADEKAIQALNETRKIIKKKQWCKEVHLIERLENKGLADSIIEGVTEIVNQYGQIIVLEDDVVTSPGFLKYMNDALCVYASTEKVMHISGYMYPLEVIEPNQETFFCNILSCWGWATWKRAWQFLDTEPSHHLARLKTYRKIKDFNICGNADFYSQLLANQRKDIYTWAVKWYASWKLVGGYSLFPKKSLVQNIGHDGSGIHCTPNSWFNTTLIDNIEVKPLEIVENRATKKQIDDYYRMIYNHSKFYEQWWYNRLFYPVWYKLQLIFGKSNI